MCEYLIRRGARYYYRRRTPEDLLICYSKAWFYFSLGTSDREEAKRLVREHAVRHDREFEAHRRRLAALSPRDREVEELAAYLANPSAFPPAAPARVLTPEQERQQFLDDEAWAQEQALEEARQEEALEIVRERLAAKREGEALQREIERVIREDALAESPEGFAGLLEEPPAARMDGGRGRGRSAPVAMHTQYEVVIGAWARERMPAQKTINRTRSLFAEFEAVTEVAYVEAVTKRHVVAYKDYLLQKGDTPANAKTKLNMIGAVFGYATSQLIIESSPAEKVIVVDKRRPQERRQPFDEVSLQAVFSSPVYAKGIRPRGGAGEAAYWLPILALYTGARLEELGQLHPEDVRQEEGIWVIRIGENYPGQNVKNDGSVRRIPIHEDVKRLGFIAFSQRAGEAKQERIFHLLNRDNGGQETSRWSKWFGRYLRKDCGVSDTRMVFHSFRHSFKYYARSSGIREDVHDAITGHKNGQVGREYGGQFPVGSLDEAIQQYSVPVAIRDLIMADSSAL